MRLFRYLRQRFSRAPKPIRCAVVCGALLTLGIGTAVTLAFDIHLDRNPSYGDAALVAQLRESIRAQGALETMDDFSQTLNGLSYEAAHDRLHSLGQALFDEHGFSGMALCGRFESSGCMHGALVEAQTESGVSAAEIAAACIEAPTLFAQRDCAHGWGHAMAFGAYDDIPSLQVALHGCRVFSDIKMVQICEYGANMEWFMEMEEREGQKMAALRNADPLSPCNKLEAENRAGCYFTITADGWNSTSRSRESFDTIETAFRRDCDSINTPRDRRSCYNGIGHFLSLQPSVDIHGLRASCTRLSSDISEQMDCIESGIVWKFIHYGDDDGVKFCLSSSGREEILCSNIPELRNRLYF